MDKKTAPPLWEELLAFCCLAQRCGHRKDNISFLQIYKIKMRNDNSLTKKNSPVSQQSCS